MLLAALNSSQSLVVGLLVGWLVGWLVGMLVCREGFVKKGLKEYQMVTKTYLPTYLQDISDISDNCDNCDSSE